MPTSINRHIADLAPAIDSASPGDFLGIHDSGGGNFHHIISSVFDVTNNGTTAYTFTGSGFSSGSDNPTLYLQRGQKYRFNLTATGHPFEIRVSNGGAAYNTGVTNNAAETGAVIFQPDMSAPNSLVYQCTNHSAMVGDIVILDNNSFLDSAATTSLIDSAYVQARQTSGGGGGLDSAAVTSLIDSAYVQAREDNSGGGGGGAGLSSFNIVPQRITTNQTLDSDQNAFSVGPTIVDSGVTITINTGARYVVI
jgi:hypothetical protein